MNQGRIPNRIKVLGIALIRNLIRLRGICIQGQGVYQDSRLSPLGIRPPNRTTISVRGSTGRENPERGSSSRAFRGSRRSDPQSQNKYNVAYADYASRDVINMPRAPSLIRFPPFLKEFSRLGTHSVEVPQQWRYFTSFSPLPFPENPSRDRTSMKFVLDLRLDRDIQNGQDMFVGSRVCIRYLTGSGPASSSRTIPVIANTLSGGKADPANWEPGTFDAKYSNF